MPFASSIVSIDPSAAALGTLQMGGKTTPRLPAFLPNDSLFAIRPVPKTDESRLGSLLRLVEANHLHGLKQIAQLFDPTGKTLFALEYANRWDDVVGTAKLKARPPGKQFPSRRSPDSRVCVQCLNSDLQPYIRAAWDLPLSLVCQKHQSLLLDTCQHCGRQIDYLRSHVTRCLCGKVFSETPQAAPLWTTAMLALFVDLGDPARYSPHSRVAQEERVASRNLIKFATVHATGAKTLSGASPKLFSRPLLLRRAHLVDLEAWFAEGSRSFVAQWSQLSDVAPWHRSRRLLRTYRFPRLSKMITAAYKAIPPQVRKQQMDAIGLPVAYNGSDLERMFSVTPDTVIYWRSRGLIPPKESPDAPNRIPFSAVAQIKALQDQGCAQEEASATLGCSTKTLMKLIRLKAIEMTGFRAKYLFDRPSLSSLATLSECFLARASPSRSRSDRISFDTLVGAVTTPFQWKRLLSLVQGPIHVLLRPDSTRLDDVSFLRDELEEHGFI